MSIRIENVVNLTVRKATKSKKHDVIYCQEDYATELYALYSKNFPKGSVNKELIHNQDLQISSIQAVGPELIIFNTVMGEEIGVEISKEKEYFDFIGIGEQYLYDWLRSEDAEKYFASKEDPKFLTLDVGGKIRGSLLKCYQKNLRQEMLEQMKKPMFAYNAKVNSKNDGGFFITISGIKGFMPGSLAATNRIIDFDSYIGKEVVVMIEDFVEDTGLFIVSHKKYIQNILPTAITKLKRNENYDGVITGSSKYGIFVEFEGIFTGLIQEKNMDETTKNQWKNGELKDQTPINIYIKSIDKNNRIHLSDDFAKLSAGDDGEDLAKLEGRVVNAKVLFLKPFGALVKIEEADQLCLLPQKELSRTRRTVKVKEELQLTIDQIDQEKGKITMKFMA